NNRGIRWVVVVNSVVVAESAFHVQAPVIFRDVLEAGTGKDPALQWRREKSHGSRWVLGRPQRVATNGKINFLSARTTRDSDQRAYKRQSEEPSQSSP